MPNTVSRTERPLRRTRAWLCASLLGMSILAGCASMGPQGVRPGGMTLAEISVMLDQSKSEEQQQKIATEIEKRGLAAQASQDDVAMLEKRGAQAPVVDAVMEASFVPPANAGYDDTYGYGYGAGYYGPYAGLDPFYSPWPWGVGVGYGWGGGFYGGGYRGYGGPGFHRGFGAGPNFRPGLGGPRPGNFRPAMRGGGFRGGGRR